MLWSNILTPPQQAAMGGLSRRQQVGLGAGAIVVVALVAAGCATAGGAIAGWFDGERQEAPAGQPNSKQQRRKVSL